MKTITLPQNIPALQLLASVVIGDGKAPNLFFVADRGVIITVTRSFERAHNEWSALASRFPRAECALEDRKTGVIACVEPNEGNEARLVTWDDSRTFGYIS